MEDFEDDDDFIAGPQVKEKHAAKISENDKDALLSSGEEREEIEEYTDIFDDESQKNDHGSTIIGSVDFEEGESVSASDDEITGYTGDMENYTESEIEQTPNIMEGTLINIQEEDIQEETVLEKSSESQTGSIPKSVTNESISEIADKLAEADLDASLKKVDQKPGKPVKITDSERGGYSSSGETSQFSKEVVTIEQRRKRYRKRTTSHSEERKDDELSSSGEYRNEQAGYVNGTAIETKHKPKKKNQKQKLHKDEEDHHKVDKLIDVETPPQTPHHPASKESVGGVEKVTKISKHPVKTIPIPGFKAPPTKTAKVPGSQKKRKRTRHKVYLDDPEVHQLINDHVTMLQKYIDDVKNDRMQKREPKPATSTVKHHHAPPHHHRHHNHSQTHPNSAPHHTHSPQQTFYGSQSPYHNQGGPYASHHGHPSRGKHVIARIRNEEELSSSSTDDEEDYGKASKHGGYQKVNTGGHHHPRHQPSSDMQVCADCGEYHAEADVREIDDICPDCGVRHNPYEHQPGSYQPNDQHVNKPWQRHTDTCRDTVKANHNQKYQAVSTEQDPEDVRQETLPSIEGPHAEQELNTGVRYKMKYLGSCQITTQHPVTKETRMQQAQDAYKRIKSQDDDDEEDDVSTNVDMFISLERIKIINKDTKFEDVMMDHALRTICFICDMGNVLVLMARRLTSDHATDFSIEQGKPITLGSIVGDREKKTSKNICHVFEAEVEASKIAKAIGQAFNMAYRQFLTSNGIAHEHVEEAEYGHVLESQKLVGQDLDRLTDKSAARDVVVNKRRGDPIGIMLLESGWGSMLPTVFIAHLANYSAAARSQRLSVGDHILTCNGLSFVGLPLSECTALLRNTKSSERVTFRVVSCPPVVDVVVSRPDVKYQLGFSVQNGTICSLLRGGIAERGGVRVGHRIIEINGDSVVAKPHQYIVDILANTVGSISMKTMPVAMYRLMVGEDQPEHV